MEIDELWVSQAKEGDDTAFSRLYECMYKDMYKYAYYMLGNEQDAEDIVSETVLDMYAGIGKLREISSFRSWSFKILSNKCKRKRKQYINKNISLDDENENIVLSTEEDILEHHDLEKAFADLAAEERNIVSLAVFGGYKSFEIGEMLNINSSTVRSKLSRALTKMQKKLEIQY